MSAVSLGISIGITIGPTSEGGWSATYIIMRDGSALTTRDGNPVAGR